MKIEIEKVIQADDAASGMVEEARARIERIGERALQTADLITAGKASELASALGVEQQRVFSEAEAKARGVLEDADRYIERIREKKKAVLQGLVEQLLKKVTGA